MKWGMLAARKRRFGKLTVLGIIKDVANRTAAKRVTSRFVCTFHRDVITSHRFVKLEKLSCARGVWDFKSVQLGGYLTIHRFSVVLPRVTTRIKCSHCESLEKTIKIKCGQSLSQRSLPF